MHLMTNDHWDWDMYGGHSGMLSDCLLFKILPLAQRNQEQIPSKTPAGRHAPLGTGSTRVLLFFQLTADQTIMPPTSSGLSKGGNSKTN